MKIFFFFTLFAVSKVLAVDHLIAFESKETSVRLTTKLSESNGDWTCYSDKGRNIPISITPLHNVHHHSSVEVSVVINGNYNCTYSTQNNGEETIYIRSVLARELPINMLAEYFEELVHHQYTYLGLSYRFLAADSYLPNVAKYFKDLMKQTAERIETIGHYILAKQVTTTELDGAHPPNYLKYFLKRGFKQIHTNLQPSYTLQNAFQAAFDLEKNEIRTLTSIAYRAEIIEDYEVEEFAVADLMPPILSKMKELSNHIRMVEAITQNDVKLGEFLFDREFS